MFVNPLYINWNFDPVFFTIFGVEVRYYGLMWALALIIAGWFFQRFCRRESLDEKIADSAFIYGTIAAVLGARVGHCLFYEPDYYLANPLEIITGIRNGGMASHGCAIGLLIGLWLFSRKNKLPYIWSLDRIMIPVALGGALVRFGNLFNSEIVGSVTDVPWGFRFLRLYPDMPVELIPAQHPAQIYEALCYLVTFAVLCWLYYGLDYGRRRPGILFGVGLIGIFFTRFIIEFFKEVQESFEEGMLLDMGQILSIPFVIAAVVIIFYALRKPEVEVQPKAQPKVQSATPKQKKSKPRKW